MGSSFTRFLAPSLSFDFVPGFFPFAFCIFCEVHTFLGHFFGIEDLDVVPFFLVVVVFSFHGHSDRALGEIFNCFVFIFPTQELRGLLNKLLDTVELVSNIVLEALKESLFICDLLDSYGKFLYVESVTSLSHFLESVSVVIDNLLDE